MSSFDELLEVRREISRTVDKCIEGVQEFLASCADKRGLSANDLAAITGLALNTVKVALGRGNRTHPPNSRTLALIAAALDVELRVIPKTIQVRLRSR